MIANGDNFKVALFARLLYASERPPLAERVAEELPGPKTEPLEGDPPPRRPLLLLLPVRGIRPLGSV